ncbi:nitrate/nitrite transporter [Paenarthrobacter sp. NPDC056912]|uniref:MFS transporter n=1 Tax=Paenarthrobacter sp. NPDC056912 TaxID=3345965 RepID=UPI00366BD69C
MAKSPEQKLFSARWGMLVLLSLGYVSLTLNWFNIAAAFVPISVDLDASFPQLALLISIFVLAYGVAHVPGGILAARIGMKPTLVIGVLMEAVGGALSGIASNYVELALYRAVAGVGASIFIAVSVAAVSVWFQDREINLAMGISAGVAFSAGVAVGLYICGYITAALGWRPMMLICGAFGVLVGALTAVLFHTPKHMTALRGGHISRAGLMKALVDKQLWIYGVAMIGVYGAYFTASQLLSDYAVTTRGFTPEEGGLLGAVLALAGIPGSYIGGWLADKTSNYKIAILLPLVIMTASMGLIPVVPAEGLWIISFVVGFTFLCAFPAWLSVPAALSKVDAEHLGTAVGVMLTLSAVGGFLVPTLFGVIVPGSGYAAGWLFLAVVSLVTVAIGFAGKSRPSAITTQEQSVSAQLPVGDNV